MKGAAQGIFLPAIASHDPFMVAHAQSEVARLKLPKERYEFQMIYGIRRICSKKCMPQATHCKSTSRSAPTGAPTSCAAYQNAQPMSGSSCAAY